MKNIPKIVQKRPYVIEEKAGKKAFCSCGLSSKDPYCDGSHKDTGFSPEIVELKENKKSSLVWMQTISKRSFL